MRFICGEQIYFEDLGPLGFLNQEHTLVVYESPYLLHSYCDISVVNVQYILKSGQNKLKGKGKE